MKKLFQQLGFTADDLAILLYTSAQTIYSWMRRNATIPWDYQVYLNALENCANAATNTQLKQVKHHIQNQPNDDFILHKEQALQALQNALNQLKTKKHQLEQKQTEVRLKVYVAQTLNNYLPENFKHHHRVTSWQTVMTDKYSWQYQKLYFEQQLPLEERLAGIEAKLDFWKQL
ncbi:MAG TPA: hypothetical protein DCS93_05135 [Microscillaceae bacterium]|nr:hypothetical protein [Microscillaceae bacterium]